MSALAIELATDELNVGYASMSDSEVAVAINAKSRTIIRDVPIGEIAGAIEKMPGCLRRLRSAASNQSLSDAVIDCADTLMRICQHQSPLSIVEMTGGAGDVVSTKIAEMISASVLTSSEGAKLLALAVAPASRAEEIGIGYVSHLDVAEARRG